MQPVGRRDVDLYFFAAGPIYAFMHSNPQVVQIGIPAFKLLALFQIPLVVGTIYVHASAVRGHPLSALDQPVRIFVVRLPLAYTCSVLLGGGLMGHGRHVLDLGIRP